MSDSGAVCGWALPPLGDRWAPEGRPAHCHNHLDRWENQVAGLLRSGGTFYIRDGHPTLYSVDENAEALQLCYPDFDDGHAQQWDEESTYVGDGTVAHSRTYEWAHPLSSSINSLIGAGLQILRVEEGKTIPWKFAPRMVEVSEGFAWPESERELIPCTYTIIARKVGLT
ncbi:hypothetical protein ACX80E_03185 [Arthrobacter sp. TMN-49]